MNIKPLHDRVVIKRCEENKITSGGIVIPDSAAEKPVQGIVVATGSGKVLNNGNRFPLAVKEGDKVLYGRYAGNEIKIDHEQFLILHESDIMAIIDD